MTLADGNAIELHGLGTMRTQLLAELRDGRAEVAAEAASAVGEAEIFGGTAGGDSAEIRVYDDALLIITAAATERISFSFVGAVRVRDYTVTVEVAGREPVMLTRLGRRSGELAELLATRLREARGRTSAFLASLLPGLDPMALRTGAPGDGHRAGQADRPGDRLQADHVGTSARRRLPSLVLYEVLNQLEPLTHIYRPDGGSGTNELVAVNRCLDDVGFQLAAVHAEGLTSAHGPDAQNSPLARWLAGKVPHDDGWASRLDTLLTTGRV